MNNLNLTIKLQDKLTAIVEKHKPQVIVIGGVESFESRAIAIQTLNKSFGLMLPDILFAVSSLDSINKTAVCVAWIEKIDRDLLTGNN